MLTQYTHPPRRLVFPEESLVERARARLVFILICFILIERPKAIAQVSEWSLSAKFFSGLPVLQENNTTHRPSDNLAPVTVSLDSLNVCGKVGFADRVDADLTPLEEAGSEGCTSDDEFPPYGITRDEWWVRIRGVFEIDGTNALPLRFTLQANHPHHFAIDGKVTIDYLASESVRRTTSVRIILAPGRHTIALTYIHQPSSAVRI